MLNAKEITHLLYLLDDPDDEIIREIEGRIMSFGLEVIPYLEQATETEEDSLRMERMRNLITALRKTQLMEELVMWHETEEQDLLEALLILNRIEDPSVDRLEINRILDKIKLDAWLELNYDLSSFEQVKILNYIFFEVHQFKGNTTDYHHIDNSILSRVLQHKKGNPVLISVVYSLIAQRLNIPVYGVNLPQHFVLGYKSSEGIEMLRRFNDPSSVSKDTPGDVLFYINAFSDGLVLSYESLKSFLEQLKIEPKAEYFNICSNLDIVRRILRNMMFSYDRDSDDSKKNLTEEMLRRVSS